MENKKQARETLISCRNILLGNRSNEHVLYMLEEFLGEIHSADVRVLGGVVVFCVREVVAQVQNSRLRSAGLILNLIHNLPLDSEDLEQWDVDYFLSMEFSAFLDHYNEVENSRKIAIYICEQIAKRFFDKK